jgi:hypothetical protein
MLTIFTAPKPFTDPHIDRIQRNAIRSWRDLGPLVEVLLIGDEAGMRQAAEELQVRQLTDVERTDLGTPRIDSIFRLARQASSQPLLAYVNADILLMPDVLDAARSAIKRFEAFLLIGQRWDLEVQEDLTVGETGAAVLRQRTQAQGSLHPPGGSDYFLFPKACFSQVPPFAVGRAGWDNWMIYHARKQGWPVIDATAAVMPVHQAHDYAHLPNGQPHYRLPESGENLRLAGGRRRVFRLPDANYLLQGGTIGRRPRTFAGMLLSLERWPVLGWDSDLLANLVFACLHPERAWQELRGALGYLYAKRIARRSHTAQGGA